MARAPRLSEFSLGAADVDAIYRAVLGRPLEDDRLWTNCSALDAIVAIATSPEARRQTRGTAETPGRYRITDGPAGIFVTRADDGVIGRSIRVTGSFDEHDVDGALALLASLGRDVTRSTFVDVGANIGTHTLAALRAGFERAVCVEPDGTNVELLRANLALNGADGRCTVVHAAASESNGVLEFERSVDNFGDHRVKAVNPGPDLYGESGRATSPVRSVRLDDVLGGEECAGLVWVDTQGHEGHVLKGAPRLVGAGSPIVLEFWPYGLARADGLDRLKQVLAERSLLYDLDRSVAENRAVRCSLADLDDMWAAFLRDQSEGASRHTNLLVL